jgi:hypothetical protein
MAGRWEPVVGGARPPSSQAVFDASGAEQSVTKRWTRVTAAGAMGLAVTEEDGAVMGV